MKNVFLAALAAIIATTAMAGVAHAAPTDVSVRIEGKDHTIFDRVVKTDGHDIRAAGDIDDRKCDGTNLGANPEPGPTPTAASVDAMTIIGEDFGAEWYDGFEDYFIQRWADDAEDGGTNYWYWGILVNQEFTPVGGCQFALAEGDEVLWVYDAFNGRPMLALDGPDQAVVGTSIDVTVTDFSNGDAVYPGAKVGGLTAAAAPVPETVTEPGTSNAEGIASVTFNQPGWKRLKATDVGSGAIATAVPSNSIDICVERVAGVGCTGEAPSRIPTQVGTPPAVEIEEPGPPDPTCETDPSLCPDPPDPTCETDPALCPKPATKPKLRFSKIDMGTRRILPGRSAKVGVTVSNRGDGEARDTKVCLKHTLKAPRAASVRVKKSCRGFSLAAGGERSLTFTVKAHRSLTGKGKIPLKLTASATGSSSLAKTTRLGLGK